MTSLTQALGQFASKPLTHSQIDKALEIAKTGFIDTIATMFAGSGEPVCLLYTSPSPRD